MKTRYSACTYDHPQAPNAEVLTQGGHARLVSPVGDMEVTIRFDARLRRDLCVMKRGGWLRHGRGVNALIEPMTTDLGDGTAYYDQRVRLEPV